MLNLRHLRAAGGENDHSLKGYIVENQDSAEEPQDWCTVKDRRVKKTDYLPPVLPLIPLKSPSVEEG
jgi:hypothetical protein